MEARINPARLEGTIRSAPSKSAAHRALICAALSDKPTTLRLSDTNADIDTTARCLRAMGAEILRENDHMLVSPAGSAPEKATLNCMESGSTLRFLLPLAAVLVPQARFEGEGRLPQRPIDELKRAMAAHGAVFDGDALPLTVSGRLRPGCYMLAGNVSSQYISGLLMALPLLEGDSEIVLTSALSSAPYVEMTRDIMARFGVIVQRTAEGFSVAGNQRYVSPGVFEIEGDWSGAAFYLAAGGIGGEVTVLNLRLDSEQGDKAIVQLLERFGAQVYVSESAVTVKASPLRACEIDVSEIPDLFPILSVLGAFSKGTTVLFNAGNLRLKESDRILSSAAMITALGGEVREFPDRLEIMGRPLTGGRADAFGDHRIAMSAAIAASFCSGQSSVSGAQAVDKSYPRFFEDYLSLGGRVTLLNESAVKP